VIDATYLIASDGTRLYAWTRQSEGVPLGVIALVHGMGEHSGRYDHLREFWVRHGYGVAGFDHRGHGRSPGRRGHTPSYRQLMDDIAAFVATVNERWPVAPVVLYGHSLGGNLVLNYAIRRRPALAALVATSPYLRLAFSPPAWKLQAAGLLRYVAPWFALPTGVDLSALSRDPAVAQRLASDPLAHERITARFFAEVQEAGEYALAQAGELRVRTLIMHGGADRVTSAEASRAFVERSGGRATLRIWNGCFHEIHNEPEWQEIAAFTRAWIERR
jgi:alpha-beta hydrolase superfamily lysophospholipase